MQSKLVSIAAVLSAAVMAFLAPAPTQAHEGHFHTRGFETATELISVQPDDRDAFAWPYVLIVPPSAHQLAVSGGRLHLLVLPNDTGFSADEFLNHEAAALRLAGEAMPIGQSLACPMLVPMFPWPEAQNRVFVQALDRDCFLTEIDVLRRPDRQLIAMADDAQRLLTSRGWTVDSRLLLSGFGVSGMFAQRFTALHPDRVLAAAVGAPGGWPLAPVERWQGTTLPYPVGIADIESLAGTPFDLEGWSAVPQFVFMGDLDIIDTVPADDGYEDSDEELVFAQFGASPAARWEAASGISASVSGNVRFRMYEETGHEFTDAMKADLVAFFRDALGASPQ